MKKILISFALLVACLDALGVGGLVNFANSPTTLISADGVPMPIYGTQPFIFAIFVAPATTVATTGITPLFSDPVWQLAVGYNTNNATVPGRINTRSNLDVGTAGGFGDGDQVDFIVRGWSANAGGTWAEAKTSWNDGAPLMPMFIGSSTVGNDFYLSFEFTTRVFGSGLSQIAGFNMVSVPEPSMLALVGLSASALWLSRRRVLR